MPSAGVRSPVVDFINLLPVNSIEIRRRLTVRIDRFGQEIFGMERFPGSDCEAVS